LFKHHEHSSPNSAIGVTGGTVVGVLTDLVQRALSVNF
jgi:hypothetical protein